ncbi:MAG: ATP-binding protein, partial [Alphaproteobacteria bacterium]|nr:ATP-binding protein [Alphaproteobacteria bacterium]
DAGHGEGSRIRNAVPGTLDIEADRDQLYRVLFNLCRSAVEAGAQHVAIDAMAEDDQVAMTLADDGHGLPPKARDNLFQPFTGSARLGGTGLGLAIARELMRAHGGDIVLVESTGAGTIFRLTLPLPSERPSIGAEERRSARSSTPEPVPQGASRRA